MGSKSTLPKKTMLQLSKLQKVSSSLLRARDISQVASIIIKEGFSALGAQSGDIVLLNDTKTTFRVIAYKGYSASIIDEVSKVPSDTLITSSVIARNKPVFIRNRSAIEKKYTFAKYFFTTTNARSAALVPLHVNNKVVGVMQFTFNKNQSFPTEDQNFMFALADQFAQALDKVIAYENLRKSRDELETILKRIADGVIVRDVKGKIIYANETAVHLHKRTNPKELISLIPDEYWSLFNFVKNENSKAIPLDMFPCMKVMSGMKYDEGSFQINLKRDNKILWLKIKSVAVSNTNNDTELIVDVIQDITEEKRREVLKDEFISIASHELKTPVTSLKAFTQILQSRFSKLNDVSSANLMEKMDTQVNKLSNLITDLLDVSKIESGKLHLTSKKFNFDELVDEMIEEVRGITSSHKITLDGKSSCIVFGDRERIGQVIINLLNNAIKYSPGKDEIIVRLKKSKKEVTLGVQDFGLGISQSKRKQIFNKFYRGEGENTFPGLGLGLYISSQIVERQHGKIWLESKKNKGTTFYFSLPIKEIYE